MSGVENLPPPADIVAEARVLGALLYDHRHVSAVPPTVTAETFYSRAHATLFGAIEELRAERIDIDRTTVEARLRARQQLPQMPDGADFLMHLVDASPIMTASAFEEHIRILLDKATLRAATRVLHEAIARAYDPGTTDVGEMLAGLERSVLNLSLTRHESGGLRPIREALRAELTEWHERAEGRGTPGTPTGFDAYDRITGGIHGGDLLVVGARPGQGKTSLVTGIAVNVARRPKEDVAFFSLEMPAQQLAARMLCTEAGMSLVRTRAGRLDARELSQATQSIGMLAKLGLYVDDARKGRPFVADIVTRSRRLAAKLAREGRRLGLIVVDYIQIVRLRDVLVKQRHELAIGEVSTELKALAKELDATVIGVAQLNRSVEQRVDKRPGMADLRDSGQIEQDADLIAMLYRDEYYNPKTPEPGIAELIIEKNRNGPTGTVKLRFDGPTTRFENLEGDRG
jgi:replicative DNA helicase